MKMKKKKRKTIKKTEGKKRKKTKMDKEHIRKTTKNLWEPSRRFIK